MQCALVKLNSVGNIYYQRYCMYTHPQTLARNRTKFKVTTHQSLPILPTHPVLKMAITFWFLRIHQGSLAINKAPQGYHEESNYTGLLYPVTYRNISCKVLAMFQTLQNESLDRKWRMNSLKPGVSDAKWTFPPDTCIPLTFTLLLCSVIYVGLRGEECSFVMLRQKWALLKCAQ